MHRFNLIKHLCFIMMQCVVTILVSCNDDIDWDNTNDTPKQTTILFYIVGNNDLSTTLTNSIQSIMTGYQRSSTPAHVLIYADFNTAPQLYLIETDKTGVVTKTSVRSYSNQNSASPTVMKSIIADVFTQYPAEKKVMVFSSHASGSLYYNNPVQKRSFGLDGSYSMNLNDLGEALSDAPYLDVVLFDACLMGNIEVASELSEHVKYLIASPNSVPGQGYPYANSLEYLLQASQGGVIQVAKNYMNYYYDDYNPETPQWYHFAATSVYDLSRMGEVERLTDSLFTHEQVQMRPYTLNRYYLKLFEPKFPLYDFGQWVDSVGLDNPYVDSVKQAVKEMVLYSDHGDYSSVYSSGNYSQLILPIDSATYSGISTFVPGNNNVWASELYMRALFTQFKWYWRSGLWRSPYYNSYAEKIE